MASPVDYYYDEWNHLNDSSYEHEIVDSNNHIVTVQVAVYCILFLIGVPGNTLVLVVFARRGDSPFNMSSNALIVNLAAADMGILLFYVPFYVAYEALDLVWPFGLAMCKFVFSLTHICVYSSLGTMIGVAMERYQVTFHLHVSKSLVRVGLLFVWICALVLSIPQMMNLQLVSLDDEIYPDTEYTCELMWPDPIYERILHPVDFILFYLLPMALISGLYIHINSMLRSAIRRNVLNHRLAKQAQKVMYVLIVVVFVFGICNFPVHFMQIYRVFCYDEWLNIFDKSPWLFSVCAALYLIPHIANPIIYAVLNKKFRLAAIKVLRTCKPACLYTIVQWNPFTRPCQGTNEEESVDRGQELI
ncbi:hypothetical protein QZH41_006882 [Actinostola sp. cb2023]|nr:hypothetical protein QZH41_006882 [Actinostola sp. cb2023]